MSQVREIFDKVMDEEPRMRAEAIARLVPDDPGLAREIMALLESEDGDSAWLEKGAGALLSESGAEDPEDWSGRRIGPYKVLREVGVGGMGAVYEAVRDDAEYERRVAIKLIKGGLDSAAIVRRFRRERQILAALEHENIARMVDGAVLPDGRPYLVMEFVDGVAIDSYCNAKRLDVRNRVDLFLGVCDAVNHAHRNLIVHRDLKPGNILVTAEGIPKLLDFGIAKLITPDTDSTSSTMTAAGFRFFTPEYASPEQIRGEQVSTSSDVYSLGVVLYELLSGVQPFRAQGRSVLGIEKILTTVPGAPSTVVTNAAAMERAESGATRLRRRLAGELDNIVLMALRKDPSRRYASVEQLAEDLRRWRDGRPVVATGDSAGYRFGKFVARNRVGVAAAAVVMISILAGSAATLWQARAARAAAKVAEAQTAQAQEVTKFLTAVIGSADPSWYSPGENVGPTTTVLQAIQHASRRVGTDLHAEPEVEANVRSAIGNAYQTLGLLDSADIQLTSAVRLRRQASPAPSMELALDLNNLGRVKYRKGGFATADSLFNAGLQMHAAIGDDSSFALAVLEGDRATSLTALGKLTDAEAMQRLSMEKARRQLGPIHAGVANGLSNMAMLHLAQGDLAGAEKYVREALAIYPHLHDRVYLEQGIALMNLGGFLKWQGKYEQSDSALRAAREVFKRTHTEKTYDGVALMQLAHLHYLMGETEQAGSEIQRAVIMYNALALPPSHPDFIRLHTVQGEILAAQGHLRESESILRGSLPGGVVPALPHNARMAELLVALGRTLALEGKLAEAGPVLSQSHADFQKAFGASDGRTRWAARADSAFMAQLPSGRITSLPR